MRVSERPTGRGKTRQPNPCRKVARRLLESSAGEVGGAPGKGPAVATPPSPPARRGGGLLRPRSKGASRGAIGYTAGPPGDTPPLDCGPGGGRVARHPPQHPPALAGPGARAAAAADRGEDP